MDGNNNVRRNMCLGSDCGTPAQLAGSCDEVTYWVECKGEKRNCKQHTHASGNGSGGALTAFAWLTSAQTVKHSVEGFGLYVDTTKDKIYESFGRLFCEIEIHEKTQFFIQKFKSRS